jgi:Xaa-Pro aminopeptidase
MTQYAPMSERVNTPISSAELERRWSAIRAAMAEQKIDVLLTQSNNDFVGGYNKYLTDMPATNGYPLTVVFPRTERMSIISQGPFGHDIRVPEAGDGIRRGVGRILGTPSYASVHFTSTYDAECALKALAGFEGATIGLLGPSAISWAMVDYLKRHLPRATFLDASPLVDEIKAVKSAEEIGLIRRMTAMQDAAAEAVTKALRPGLRDMEIVEIARAASVSLGSEQGWYMAASGPVGTAAVMQPPHLQNRTLQAGDQFCMLIENAGPGGYYGEIGRTWVLGKASQEMQEEFAFVLKAQRFTLDLMKPGADPAEILQRYNAFMREHKKPEEQRLYAHGQGYDMVERPIIRDDETMKLGRNMLFAVHPTYVTARTYSWVCDNWLLNEAGTMEALHRFPQRITEL